MSQAYTKKLPVPKKVYVIDFFCGCGGMSIAFQNSRQSHWAFEILAGIDIDKKSLLTYKENIQSEAVCMDIKDIAENPQLLLNAVPLFYPQQRCRPLVFIGCAPCQGFSAHRKKDSRDDPRNSLMMAFANVCAEFRPDIIVMENVPEILTGKYRKYFTQASLKLEEAGYGLTMDVVDLSLFGVPQRRKRAIVLGALQGSLSLPEPVFTQESSLTVRHAISHLEPISSGEADPYDPTHLAPNHTKAIIERIRKTPADGGDRRALSTAEQLRCHSSVDNGLTPGFTDVYGRLRWDTPSVTITAKSSTPSCGRFLHPEQHRNISIREAAILQGFPQSYKFMGPMVHQYRQIGEAVPPLYARFLAWQILDFFSPRKSLPSKLFQPPMTRPAGRNRTESRLLLVDMFCGAGGLSLGFEESGYSLGFASDIDEDCVATFANNISQNVECLDISNIETVERVTEITKTGRPFVVVGGPPCQGFSQQRRGADDDPRNNLVLVYGELIQKLPRKPVAVVLENVTYLGSPRGRLVLESYLMLMKKCGYRVFRHDLNSANFAVPQLRHRIVVVAIQEQIADFFKIPRSLTPKRWETIGETLLDLVRTESATNLFFSSLANHERSREGDLNKRRIAYVDMGMGRLSIPAPLQLPCHVKYGGHLDVYGRLDWFSQARTITGGFDSFTRGEYGHPFFHRSLTAREAARIQGFPDWFVFEGNRASVRKQIGNAVPPPMAYSLARAIKNTCRHSRII